MTTLCHLQFNIGAVEVCPEDRCAFWETDGCALEQLGLQGADPEVSAYLLEVRSRLEAVRDAEDEELGSGGEA